MTEIAYLLDPRAYEAEMAREEKRLAEAIAARVENTSETAEDERAKCLELASEGLKQVVMIIGETAVDKTLDMISTRHQVGHNHSLPRPF